MGLEVKHNKCMVKYRGKKENQKYNKPTNHLCSSFYFCINGYVSVSSQLNFLFKHEMNKVASKVLIVGEENTFLTISQIVFKVPLRLYFFKGKILRNASLMKM